MGKRYPIPHGGWGSWVTALVGLNATALLLELLQPSSRQRVAFTMSINRENKYTEDLICMLDIADFVMLV